MMAHRLYELTVVIGTEGETDGVDGTHKLVEALIEKSKGKISEKEDWGLKPMAYEVRKQTQGHYLHYWLELAADKAETFRGYLKHEHSFLRWLLVSAEENQASKEA